MKEICKKMLGTFLWKNVTLNEKLRGIDYSSIYHKISSEIELEISIAKVTFSNLILFSVDVFVQRSSIINEAWHIFDKKLA